MLLRRILLANVYHCVLQTPIAALASVALRLVAVQALAGAPCLGIRMRNRRGAASLAPVVLVVWMSGLIWQLWLLWWFWLLWLSALTALQLWSRCSRRARGCGCPGVPSHGNTHIQTHQTMPMLPEHALEHMLHV